MKLNLPALAPKSRELAGHLPRWKKLIYGTGDWGKASFNTLRQIFYAIFLTDVVGIDPRLASIAMLVAIIWDAINDPLVGALSDNVRTRWGRRRPFLLLFAVPFALAFVLMWWAPPWKSQLLLTLHVTLAYMVSDTIQTLVTVPYLSLTPEIAADYDERTSLTTFRMFFNLLASLITAVAAPSIVDAAIKGGHSSQQGYLIVAAIFGLLAIFPFLVIFAVVREREAPPVLAPESQTLKQTLKILWTNAPFRYASGIYVLNWVAFDVVGLMLPYFLLYWIGRGNLLARMNLFGIDLSMESAVLGIMLVTATLALPLWNWLAHKLSKRSAYIIGMVFWIFVEMLILIVQPYQTHLMILFSFLAGLSVSTAHVMPEALFPDVIDWDELRTHTRREGMYYGAINFLRKMSSAIATFFSLQVLGWFGYQTPPRDAIQFMQPDLTVNVIRFMTGPVIAVLLLFAVLIARSYPLTRDRQIRIRRMLQKRQARSPEYQTAD
ncbi:sugar (Glycoside-Pentoside-Hexuronide) transporter [Longilinea arvoryzae]|uniref:Sugar (Glycoside-Pentoside-Hexuronide) transporter n=1 Tax=Longilinea arvoryzae TaxID=360412 RepID=A0A0S7BL23_9CHLR|nr:MFS transporter [Longilinea arvoryzae]GAP14577.1 sugar (Glycoside-Pentoside-Hexuronide) transporter [Longilinea arvoryzae]